MRGGLCRKNRFGAIRWKASACSIEPAPEKPIRKSIKRWTKCFLWVDFLRRLELPMKFIFLLRISRIRNFGWTDRKMFATGALWKAIRPAKGLGSCCAEILSNDTVCGWREYDCNSCKITVSERVAFNGWQCRTAIQVGWRIKGCPN